MPTVPSVLNGADTESRTDRGESSVSNAMSYSRRAGCECLGHVRTRSSAQTMGYVALTAGLFALGAYLGRDSPTSWRCWVVGFMRVCRVCIAVLHVSASNSLTVALRCSAIGPGCSALRHRPHGSRTTRAWTPRPCGRPAERARSSWRASGRSATPPDATSRGSGGRRSSRSSDSSSSGSCSSSCTSPERRPDLLGSRSCDLRRAGMHVRLPASARSKNIR